MHHVRKPVQTRYCSLMRTLTATLLNTALALLAGLLVACSSGDSGGAGGSSTAAQKRPPRPADATARTMVSAIAANKPSAVPVQVRFDIKEHPEAGQPVDIHLALVPISGSIDHLSGTVAGDDGLDLIDGAEIPPVDHPADGVPIMHAIKVRPARDGIYTFKATVTVDSAAQTSTETFTMPLIAGAGVPATPAKPATRTAAPH